MSAATTLSANNLFRRCDPKSLEFETTDDLEALDEPLGQDRAVEAIQFAIGIRHHGYNLFVIGPTGMGKHRFVRRFLDRQAKDEPVPCDWCYVNNFDDIDKPKALQLPTGVAKKLQSALHKFVEELKLALPTTFESDDYRRRKWAIEEESDERKKGVLKQVQEEAEERNIALVHTQMGLTFLPKVDGEVIAPDAMEDLKPETKEAFEESIDALQDQLREGLQKRIKLERDRREKTRKLNRKIATGTTRTLIARVKRKFKGLPEVHKFLAGVHKDVVDNLEEYFESTSDDHAGDGDSKEAPEASLRTVLKESDRLFDRYGVNIMMDGSAAEGAPIVFEDDPTSSNLVGRIEYHSEMGALSTDVSLIRPGALHRANNGYLILEARTVLQRATSWETLKRALRSNEIHPRSPTAAGGSILTESLQPEAIPLEVQVVLLAEPWLYYNLASTDPDIEDLFKVAAEFEDEMDRGDLPLDYARLLATLVRSDNLRPFEAAAIARVIEHSSRLVDDSEKLSTHMDSIVSLLREAEYFAGLAEREHVTKADVQEAIDAKLARQSRARDQVLERMLRGVILIDTVGEEIGQINGLSVLQIGQFAFGRPTRITAQVRLGKGDVLDIEREVHLGGPIHSKGVLILTGYLGARFARHHPLALSAALVFEQSYGGVDGDSASTAELCALLSAIADIPLRQSFAVTGSINQRGEVQAVGGVNQKIEGYFDLVKARGLTGDQGVIIPKSTIPMLMLRKDVRDAVADGLFSVHAVDNVDQALELLTGMPAGEPDQDGVFPENSFNRLVVDRLAEMAEDAKALFGNGRD